MSKDKRENKRAYSIRGAVTKRRRKQAKAGGGKKSKPGHTYTTVCPECPRSAEGAVVAVAAKTKETRCKNGHTWTVGGASYLTPTDLKDNLG